jgi:hypothetical protein
MYHPAVFILTRILRGRDCFGACMHAYICMFVYMDVCMHVFMFLCMYVYAGIYCVYVCMIRMICTCVCIYVYSVCMYTYVCLCVRTYVCMYYQYVYACIHACMQSASMYELYLFIYVCIYAGSLRFNRVFPRYVLGASCGHMSKPPTHARTVMHIMMAHMSVACSQLRGCFSAHSWHV